MYIFNLFCKNKSHNRSYSILKYLVNQEHTFLAHHISKKKISNEFIHCTVTKL